MRTNDSPAEVAERVKRDLKTQGTLYDAAEKIGISAAALSNHLNGKKYISRKQAEILNKAFGYSVDYLVLGSGPLFDEEIARQEPRKHHVIERIVDTIQNAGKDETIKVPDPLDLFIKDYRRLKALEQEYTELCNQARELIKALKAFIKDYDDTEQPKQIDLDQFLGDVR